MRRWMYPSGLAVAALVIAFMAGSRKLPHPGGVTVISDPPVTHREPRSGGALTLKARLDRAALLADIPTERSLVVTVHSEAVPDDDREPVDVSVVMDVSGSMSGKGKIEYARAAAHRMVEMLGDRDRLSIVTFSDRATTVWPSQPVVEKMRIFSLVEGIREGGGTNMYDGLQAGLGELRKSSPNPVRRLVLLSDGYANIGISDSPSLSSLVGRETERGITTSSIGLGLDYNEDLLANMADAGGGSYRFVDDPSLLTGIFAQELSAITRTVAHNAVLKIDVPPGVRVLEAYGYSDPSSPGSYEAYLGDVVSGQDRKLVLRLAVDSPHGASMDLAAVHLSYVDLGLDREENAEIGVRAVVTRDDAEAANSFDKEAGILATRAKAATVAEAAARAFQQNDRASARSRLEEARAMIREMAEKLDAPELKSDEQAYSSADAVYAAAPAESEEGQRAIKAQKEVSRANAR